jgi:uncharacterized protein (TIGR02246 family)
MQQALEDARDRLELRRLVEQYARGADDRDAVLYADVFTDDAVLYTNMGEVRGRDALLKIAPKLARYRVTMHLVANHYVDFAPATSGAVRDAATGSVYCIAKHVYERDGVERVYVMHIRYDDQYRRLDGGWRIAERRLNLLFDEDHALRP